MPREMGFTFIYLAMAFFRFTVSFVINYLVLYCIAYAAGGPFSVAQKRDEKTLWPGLTRCASRPLNAALFPCRQRWPAVRLVGVNFHGSSPLKVQFLAASLSKFSA